MSGEDDFHDPKMPIHEVRQKVRRILDQGFVDVEVPHLKERLDKHKLEMGDVVNVLRGGVLDGPEMDNGEWRYHARTQKITVVFHIVCSDELVVITAWRN